MEFIGTGVNGPSSPILQGGFANLASFLVRLVTVIGGLFATWNFIAAGYKFMNAGEDPEAITKAWGSIWKSLIGLLLIVASFVFAAFIGWIFLGSPTAIIAPDFSTTPPVVAPATPVPAAYSVNIESVTVETTSRVINITLSGTASGGIDWVLVDGSNTILMYGKGATIANPINIIDSGAKLVVNGAYIFKAYKPGGVVVNGTDLSTNETLNLLSATITFKDGTSY